VIIVDLDCPLHGIRPLAVIPGVGQKPDHVVTAATAPRTACASNRGRHDYVHEAVLSRCPKLTRSSEVAIPPTKVRS